MTNITIHKITEVDGIPVYFSPYQISEIMKFTKDSGTIPEICGTCNNGSGKLICSACGGDRLDNEPNEFYHVNTKNIRKIKKLIQQINET